MSGIQICEVRVRNFRCLQSIDVRLDRLTVLLGPNNAGKSSFLQALFLAIGIGQKSVHPEAIFLRKSDRTIPKSRGISIDVLIRPTSADGIIGDSFPEGSPWLELWGSGVVQDAEDHDLVAIRTTFQWNAIKGEYLLERKFLKTWSADSAKWAEAKPLEPGGTVSSHQLEPIGLFLLDAQRDIAEDLKSRSSYWGKMVEDHGLSDVAIEAIEASLTAINKELVDGSAVFSHIQTHLDRFHETLTCETDAVSITPLARTLRDLSRGMDVSMSTSGAPSFSIQQQGMGTRSLGTFLSFWAFTTWRQQLAKTSALHPLMAMEEPECHLHPQAQRSLFRQICNMPGQRIISTHSPHICSLAQIASMRHFSKRGEETFVTQLAADAPLTLEDLRKIDRQVMNTRGDILFARALIFFEGETEEQALPDFAQTSWGRHPHELGLGFIGVGGKDNYLPFLRLADMFDIPWFIFSDGEPSAVKSVNSALSALAQPLAADNFRVSVIPDGDDFEAYIVKYSDLNPLIIDDINRRATNPQHRAGLAKEWSKRGTSETATYFLDEMSTHKTQYGARIGKLLPVPPILEALFLVVKKELSQPHLPAQLLAPQPVPRKALP